MARNAGETAEPGPPEPPLDLASYPIDRNAGVIRCVRCPNVALRVERGLVVTEELRASYPSPCIFLDGVFDGPPFLDNKNRQYSFDHHRGCVRAFMLSTCEQAALMVMQGLPLGEGSWTLYVNQPDLDAVLAAWLLMNHATLRADELRLLRRAMPLVRVEGLIDAHGLEMEAFLSTSHRLYEGERTRIQELRAEEMQLRASGEWDELDLTPYTRRLLAAIDAEFLHPWLHRLARHTHAKLPKRKLAVLCTAGESIYEVETHLRQRYHDELGLIILDRGNGRMTLRQVDPFLPCNLDEIYPALNARDPNVAPGADDCWGGADDIGGSPRLRGTGLGGVDVLRIISVLFGEAEGSQSIEIEN
jgi:hypothetical protein